METTHLAMRRVLLLKPRINRFAFHGQHAERAFMNLVKRILPDKPLQRFHAKGEFLQGQVLFPAEGTFFQPLQMIRLQVFRTVDDPEVLAAPALDCWLQKSAVLFGNEGFGLDNHTFSAGAGQIQPPLYAGLYACLIFGIDANIWGFHINRINDRQIEEQGCLWNFLKYPSSAKRCLIKTGFRSFIF